MITALKVFSWIGIVTGGLALLGSLEQFVAETFFFSCVLISWGVVTLQYLKDQYLKEILKK